MVGRAIMLDRRQGPSASRSSRAEQTRLADTWLAAMSTTWPCRFWPCPISRGGCCESRASARRAARPSPAARRTDFRFQPSPRTRQAGPCGPAKPLSSVAGQLSSNRPPRKSPSRVCDDDRVGPAKPADAPSGLALADHGLLLRRALADEVADHDEPGRDARPAQPVFRSPRKLTSRRVHGDGSPALTALSASSSCARGQPK